MKYLQVGIWRSAISNNDIENYRTELNMMPDNIDPIVFQRENTFDRHMKDIVFLHLMTYDPKYYINEIRRDAFLYMIYIMILRKMLHKKNRKQLINETIIFKKWFNEKLIFLKLKSGYKNLLDINPYLQESKLDGTILNEPLIEIIGNKTDKF